MARSIFFYTDSRVLGGAENAMFLLLESLDRDAWLPTLLLDDAPGVESLIERADGLKIPYRRIEPMPLGLAGARRVPALVRMLWRERPTVFHAHMSSPVAAKYPLAAAVLARVPAVLGTVQVAEFEPDRLTYLQLRALALGVDRYFAVSRDIAAQLVGRLGWPAAKIEVLYNAVDLGRFALPEQRGLREQLGAGEARPLVLTPARLNKQKGHSVLLEAIAQVPDAVFALAGEGPERPALEALAARLGIADRVRFLGYRTDIPRLLGACDLFALPSLYEGSSLAVLEAMAAGRAVVSSAIGGTDELIEDGYSGLLVPPGDAAALASALRRLLGDRELRETFAARARERVKRDLTREPMAHRVEGVYRELVGDSAPEPTVLPGPRRNELLRRVDWRFLVPGAEPPCAVDLTPGGDSEALRMISTPAQPGEACLALAGFPSTGSLRIALEALAPGGTLVCRWRRPRIAGPRLARRRLRAAGFTDVRVYWAGPLPHRQPQFWLPLDSHSAVEHLLAARPPRSAVGSALRGVWRLVAAAGLLAPLHAIARAPGEAAQDEVPIPPSASLLLLTGGHRSINKVVGLAIEEGLERPTLAVKFARVAEAESGLEREAAVLRQIGEERPGLAGVPRLLGQWRRCGRLAIAEEAIEGESMLDVLTPENFAELAGGVTRLLIELADGGGSQLGIDRRARLVDEPLVWFEQSFGPVLAPGAMSAARRLLAGLGDLPPACEHRDCSPWNVVLAPDGSPVLLDWESADPDGLPGMDLVYFLTNCAFVLDHALEAGSAQASYAALLDPAAPHGRVAAAAIEEYTAALGIRADDFRRLRLLCWIVHSRSDYQHLDLDFAGRPDAESLRGAVFPGLVEAELALGEDPPPPPRRR